MQVVIDNASFDTCYMLSHKDKLNESAKRAVEKVVKWYLENSNGNYMVHSPSNDQRKIREAIEGIKDKLTYDNIAAALGTQNQSFEHLTAKLLMAFMSQQPTDPMKLLQYTYGRVPPLQSRTEWMDNYRINNLGFPLTQLVWGKHDPDVNKSLKKDPSQGTIFSVKTYEPKPINESVDLGAALYERVYKFLVTPFRAILLDENTIDYKQTCDACYQKYAVCYGGAHGWDIFHIKDMSLTIEELSRVLRRYPSWNIAYVLNTATYASCSGVHWVAFMMSNENDNLVAKLVCSQGSSFDAFRTCKEFTGPLLSTELADNGFLTKNNKCTVQRDNYNCGFYAPMFLWQLINYDGKIEDAVIKGVGVDGKNIHDDRHTFSGGIEQLRENSVGSE
jgi:hypothetical protein